MNWIGIYLTITMFLVVLGIYTLKIKPKNQVNYAFLGFICNMIICNIGSLILLLQNNNIDLFKLSFIGITFIPVTFLLVALAFSKNKIGTGYYFLYLIPIVTNILLWTKKPL